MNALLWGLVELGLDQSKDLVDNGIKDVSAQDRARDDELAVLESTCRVVRVLDVEAVEPEQRVVVLFSHVRQLVRLGERMSKREQRCSVEMDWMVTQNMPY
jgi:hypothetical protein